MLERVNDCLLHLRFFLSVVCIPTSHFSGWLTVVYRGLAWESSSEESLSESNSELHFDNRNERDRAPIDGVVWNCKWVLLI